MRTLRLRPLRGRDGPLSHRARRVARAPETGKYQRFAIALCYRRMRESIRFLLNGERVDAGGQSRRRRRCWNTCATSGVSPEPRKAAPKAIAAPAPSCSRSGRRRARAAKPINACIRLAAVGRRQGDLHRGKPEPRDGTLHPVQQALVDCHGVAVRLLHARIRDEPVRPVQDDARRPRDAAIDDALSGNLCRCTGYRPIVDAAQRMRACRRPTDGAARHCGRRQPRRSR